MTPVAVILKQYQTPAGIQIKTHSSRIPVVTESRISPAAEVREKFKRVKPLREISVTQRGWTLDGLNIVRRISDRSSPAKRDEFAHSKSQSRLTSAATNTFTNEDVYTFTRPLARIRWRLIGLCDAGLLQHVSPGLWRLP
jgi:hypothetical protein